MSDETTNTARSAWARKKYQLTLLVFAVGVYIAWRSNADLGAWTLFGTFVLGTFAAADVADKRLNGPG
jgi:hypothetical protein